ncbi:ABC transporter substrate-binding protein [Thiomonas sp. FB-6]|uniref:substrate-binding periplasmic protein n=1 Tax=Thiomonas sp. FB-6 TaxID=1158291 RepID=UPI000379196A|nr:ABC transporter substrate-binding protein [Thiomonas sp. FB-6]
MKFWKALAAACLAGAAVLGAAGACAASPETPSPDTLSPGVLRVAYRADDKPVSFLRDGKPAGLLVDLMNDIGRRMGLRVEYVSTSFAAMLPSVRNHQYDTAAFGVLVTPARRKVVDFTTAIGYGQARLVSRASEALATVQSASGKTIAVTIGSALIPQLARIAPHVVIRQFPNIAASVDALLAGQVDGLFTGEAAAAHVIAQHHGLVASQTVESGMNAFPVAKDRPALLAAMNQALAGSMRDGTFTRLFLRWNPPSVTIPARLYADYPGMPHPAAH